MKWLERQHTSVHEVNDCLGKHGGVCQWAEQEKCKPSIWLGCGTAWSQQTDCKQEKACRRLGANTLAMELLKMAFITTTVMLLISKASTNKLPDVLAWKVMSCWWQEANQKIIWFQMSSRPSWMRCHQKIMTILKFWLMNFPKRRHCIVWPKSKLMKMSFWQQNPKNTSVQLRWNKQKPNWKEKSSWLSLSLKPWESIGN